MSNTVRLYSVHELALMLKSEGLETESIHGALMARNSRYTQPGLLRSPEIYEKRRTDSESSFIPAAVLSLAERFSFKRRLLINI